MRDAAERATARADDNSARAGRSFGRIEETGASGRGIGPERRRRASTFRHGRPKATPRPPTASRPRRGRWNWRRHRQRGTGPAARGSDGCHKTLRHATTAGPCGAHLAARTAPGGEDREGAAATRTHDPAPARRGCEREEGSERGPAGRAESALDSDGSKSSAAGISPRRRRRRCGRRQRPKAARCNRPDQRGSRGPSRPRRTACPARREPASRAR